MAKLTCTEVLESIPAMALGALDEHDRLAISTHIATCSGCCEQYRHFTEVSHCMLETVPQRMPPAALKRAIMMAIELPTENRAERLVRWFRHAITLPGWVLGSAVMTGVLVIGVIGYRYMGLAGQRDQLTRQLQEQQLVVSVMSRSDRQSFTMTGTVTAKDANATLMFVPDASTGILLVHNLASLPENQSYQLWLIDSSGKRDSGAVFNLAPGQDGTATLIIYAPQALNNYVKCGVSIEPRGGSPKPTGPTALTGAYL